jgi:23S rRNA (adenine2503-C2)-methyltransferase
MTIDTQRVNLMGMTLAQLEQFFLEMGEKKYRAAQVVKWIHQRGVSDIDAMSDISKVLRDKIKLVATIMAPEVTYSNTSKDGTVKWIMTMPGGSSVETVYIPEEGRGTLCVSSQIGCALDCSFCSTGKQGFNRDLSAAEIIGQVWLAAKYFDKPDQKRERRITNVVMMGMGEPLLNFDNVIPAMNLMMEDNAYGISKRRVTLSTSGVVPQIDKMVGVTDVCLALSLHAPDDALRNQLVPLNKRYNIQMVMDACNRYMASLSDIRVVTVEYTLMNGINDAAHQAVALAELLKQLPCKINLIPFNPFPNSGYERPSNNRMHTFREILQKAGHNVTIRKTRGDDIDAACGQLVGRVADITRRSEKFIQAVELGNSAADIAKTRIKR